MKVQVPAWGWQEFGMGKRMLSPVSIKGEEDDPVNVTPVIRCNIPQDCECRTWGKSEKTDNLEYFIVSFLCLNLRSI